MFARTGTRERVMPRSPAFTASHSPYRTSSHFDSQGVVPNVYGRRNDIRARFTGVRLPTSPRHERSCRSLGTTGPSALTDRRRNSIPMVAPQRQFPVRTRGEPSLWENGYVGSLTRSRSSVPPLRVPSYLRPAEAVRFQATRLGGTDYESVSLASIRRHIPLGKVPPSPVGTPRWTFRR